MTWKKLPPRVNLGSPIWSVGDWLSVCCSIFFGQLLAFPLAVVSVFLLRVLLALFSRASDWPGTQCSSAWKPSMEHEGI